MICVPSSRPLDDWIPYPVTPFFGGNPPGFQRIGHVEDPFEKIKGSHY